MDFFRRQDWDIVGKAWLWLGISAVTIIIGMTWWAVAGLNLGVDFTGGVLLRYQFDLPISGGRAEEAQLLGQIRSMLAEHKLAKSQIQLSGNNQLFIRVPARGDEEGAASAADVEKSIHDGLDGLLGDKYGAITVVGSETVGPIVGKQLRDQALYALVLGCLLILIYITIRYEFRFAVASILALLHDVGIIIGAVAILRIELDTSFVAALLTIIGYSINDTVVIFDRIRENRRLRRGAPFAETVNASLLQTMARSINTILTTLLPLIALAIFGGTSIRGFAITLIIGIASGAYSSIFNASPALVLWERYSARKRQAGRPGRPSDGRRATRRRLEVDEPVEDDDAERRKRMLPRPPGDEAVRARHNRQARPESARAARGAPRASEEAGRARQEAPPLDRGDRLVRSAHRYGKPAFR